MQPSICIYLGSNSFILYCDPEYLSRFDGFIFVDRSNGDVRYEAVGTVPW